eukprot:TRINITY_DN10932_c0_g1_i1.p1 TRINITY_DN10932_c0_g1~~TRINITY_DN10932_c0_g1_i1.p1  ORF type:complete len:1022 (+),score=140.01 TRINITY_DN10932_c0_g1_i1:16-3081(+)
MAPTCEAMHAQAAGAMLQVILLLVLSSVGISAVPTAAQLEECWSESAFSEHLCCDTSHGPTGFFKCWGGPYTFESCCGAPPECSQQLSYEVWEFLDPSAQTTFRDFWRSDAFYKIGRARLGAHKNCSLAFLASRALAFTKLQWLDQWNTLHSPRKALHDPNFQLRAIVEALWSMVKDIPLWDVLSSPPWSTFLLGRLYGHSKKLNYYLLPDGTPLLQGRLPKSDVSNTMEDETFLQLVKRRLNLKLPLPVEEAHEYLAVARRSQAFGRITACLVLVASMLAYASGHRRAAFKDAKRMIAEAEIELRSWAIKNDYADFFFTRWPVFRLMVVVASVLEHSKLARQYLPYPEQVEDKVFVVSCSKNIQIPDKFGWEVLQFTSETCTRGLRVAVHKAAKLTAAKSWFVLISPFIWKWDPQHASAIREALWLVQDPAAAAVGFPSIDENGTWQWPLRRLDLPSGSKLHLRYRAYPTGYTGSEGICALGDSTSGTRAYRRETLARLLEDSNAEDPAALLVELDILARKRSPAGTAAMACMVPPLHENSYLRHMQLPLSLAVQYGFELSVLQQGQVQLHCRKTELAEARKESSDHLSPCAASDVRSILQVVSSQRVSAGGRIWAECSQGTQLPLQASSNDCPSVGRVKGRFRLESGSVRSAEHLCSELLQESRGLDCKANEVRQALICGQAGRGCIELVVAASTTVEGVQVQVWGHTFWAAFSGSQPTRAPAADVAADVRGKKIFLLYCGPLSPEIRERWNRRILQQPLDSCGSALRNAARHIPVDAWVVLVSSFAWDEKLAIPSISSVAAGIAALQHDSDAVAVGFPVLDLQRRWRWPAQKLQYGYWKLHYRDMEHGVNALEAGTLRIDCAVAETTSGTRVYKPGVLRAMLQKTVSADPATLIVELDLLAKLGRRPSEFQSKERLQARGMRARTPAHRFKGHVLTCTSREASSEEPFTLHARLPAEFAQRYQLEGRHARTQLRPSMEMACEILYMRWLMGLVTAVAGTLHISSQTCGLPHYCRIANK